MTSNLGIIEGFYGKPWGFAKRKALIPFMKAHNYGFYIYAPKADIFLREKWQEPVPASLLQQLKTLGEQLKANNIQWAIGLSPFDLHQNFNDQAKVNLLAKVEQLKGLGINCLAILFDDMKGEFVDLAQRQIDICHFIQANSHFDRLVMCPSYYCFDPILEKVFGKMPKHYLEDIGKGLDHAIEIFWTGEKVCTQNYGLEHLESVAKLLRRRPFIWDNYPVNDGASMSPFLHLSAFTGREYCHDQFVSGVAVNPMNEAFLSQIPLASLHESLSSPDSYQAEQSFQKWAQHFLGDAAQALIKDKELFEKQGLDALNEKQKQQLIVKYQSLMSSKNKNLIEELLEYLQGEYLFDVHDEVPTQLLWE